MRRILLPVVAALAFASGCYTRGDVGVGYSYGYAAPAPDLYYMSPGVSVVAYSDYPVFYSDNYYWRYDNGLWYRSSYWNGGWSVAYNVPYYVRSIDRPYSYARFRPGTGWSRAPAPGYRGGYRDYGGVRDHRSGSGYYRPAPARPAPGVRDHRSGYNPPARTNAPPAGSYRPVTPARDHRASPGPTHRQGPPASAGPARRDHRR